MNRALLGLMVFLSLASIGCNKKKKESNQAMVNACLFDPTGNCPRQAAAMAQANGLTGGANGTAPETLPYINQLSQNPAILTGNGAVANNNGSGTQVASISDADLKKHNAQVQSAIKADSMNPSSLHYDPPQSQVPTRDPASVQAARALPTQNQQVGLPQAVQSPSEGESIR